MLRTLKLARTSLPTSGSIWARLLLDELEQHSTRPCTHRQHPPCASNSATAAALSRCQGQRVPYEGTVACGCWSLTKRRASVTRCTIVSDPCWRSLVVDWWRSVRPLANAAGFT